MFYLGQQRLLLFLCLLFVFMETLRIFNIAIRIEYLTVALLQLAHWLEHVERVEDCCNGIFRRCPIPPSVSNSSLVIRKAVQLSLRLFQTRRFAE